MKRLESFLAKCAVHLKLDSALCGALCLYLGAIERAHVDSVDRAHVAVEHVSVSTRSRRCARGSAGGTC